MTKNDPMSYSEKGRKKISEKRKKMIVTVMAGILLALLYVVIFSFSEQDGEKSGSVSMKVSEKCVDIVNDIARKNWTDVMKKELARYFEHPIRKLAHFTEYACMGALVYLMWRPWKEKGRKLYLIVLLWVFLSAGADECHQLFVPGRDGSFLDVCLDTTGGLCGLTIAGITERIGRALAGRRQSRT